MNIMLDEAFSANIPRFQIFVNLNLQFVSKLFENVIAIENILSYIGYFYQYLFIDALK